MKILIAEDDLVSRRLLKVTLEKWGYEVLVTCNGREAWEVLQQDDTPQLAILDWMMPEMDGPAVCQKVRQRKQEPYIYIVLLTAKGQKEDLIVGLEAGADDYLTKPFNPYELQLRLRIGTRILTLQAELIAAREALRIQATHDPLTGIWNRAAILDLLARELERSKREETSMSIVIIDLDHFKQINDTYGHLAGDRVLRETTQRIRSSIRAYDAIGRYGGEEFLVIFPGCDASKALKQAERLRLCICKEQIQLEEGHISLTISLGVAVSTPTSRREVEALIQAADTALYQAKRDGRNRVALAEQIEITESPATESTAL